ncbi:hypothetical protein SKAU_G00244910 [Synaphobranchus kaupii]|uniref:Centriolar satellite-associated tubulin polyglutamylase complex regulator 1 n=1 Tax=Synaphobranchus kaupii TaxID=118154 RepID=A0A9Q1F1W4_SYNKA|nr:hypothetical protein SKAU_G00244910 [Synaphobranchus kaupii]
MSARVLPAAFSLRSGPWAPRPQAPPPPPVRASDAAPHQIVLMDDAMDCPMSFADFIYAFQVQFYFEG